MPSSIPNVPAPNTSYFTPAQIPPAGTALDPQPDGKPIPILFQPIKIRGVEFHNRIFVSPMCMYSAQNGRLTEWHKAHLGGILTRGPGLTIVEATGVVPQGRITPECSGLWSDDQIPPLREIVELAHSQGVKIGIQLAHAGRKASTVAPWLHARALASVEYGGWSGDVWGPSAIPYSDALAQPKELTKDWIKQIVRAFVESAQRALRAGFDVIEIHNAHGYLLHEFLSPVSNKRTDEYGGSFENRIRLTLEVVDAVRLVIPKDMPLFLRISATDWLEESLPNEPSWTVQDTVKLSSILASRGIDLLDVSSAGLHPAQRPIYDNGGFQPMPNQSYQAALSKAVKEANGISTATGLFVGTVGGITSGHIAEEILQQRKSDVTFVGRQFLRDPATVLTFAEELEVKTKVAHQFARGLEYASSVHGRQTRGLAKN